MITSAQHQPWPTDSRIADLAAAGLRERSTVRLKLFTLDNRLLLRRMGHLSAADRKLVTQNLQSTLT